MYVAYVCMYQPLLTSTWTPKKAILFSVCVSNIHCTQLLFSSWLNTAIYFRYSIFFKCMSLLQIHVLCVMFLCLVLSCGFLYLISMSLYCVLLCLMFWFSMPHCVLLVSPMFFPCLPLSVVFLPPSFFLCAPPPRYLTWPPPSSISSPVPHLVVTVWVLLFMLLAVCSPLVVCLGFEFCFFDLNFAYWLYFVLLFLGATLSCWFFSTFLLSPSDCFCTWLPWFFGSCPVSYIWQYAVLSMHFDIWWHNTDKMRCLRERLKFQVIKFIISSLHKNFNCVVRSGESTEYNSCGHISWQHRPAITKLCACLEQ